MFYKIILSTNGNFETGFKIQAVIERRNIIPGNKSAIANGILLPDLDIPRLYRQTFASYPVRTNGEPRSLYQDWKELTRDGQTTENDRQFHARQILENSSRELEQRIRRWFRTGNLGEIYTLIAGIPNGSKAQIILKVPEDPILQRLPWYMCDWFSERFPDTEVVLSRDSFEVKPVPSRVRMLVIVGAQDGGINTTPDEEALERLRERLGYSRDDFDTLYQPQRNKLSKKIRDGKFNIIFYVGHSGDDGSIGFRSNEFITIDDLEQEIKQAVRNGLKMILLNSCNGNNIALRLSAFKVPYSLVMREAICDDTAVTFIEHCLEHLASGDSLTKSVAEARKELRNLEPHRCCASWMPTIFQSESAPDFVPFPKNSLVAFIQGRKKWIGIPLAGLALIGGIVAIVLHLNPPTATTNPDPTSSTVTNESICDTVAKLKHISCGDKILLMLPQSKIRQNKQTGFDALKQKNYDTAIKFLKLDWETAKDPETLIALNNAQLAKTPDTNIIKTIAVVVPSSETPIFVATAMLKAFAEAQKDWNQSTNHNWKVRVIVADDSNDPGKGGNIAGELVKYPKILAVLGHYSSNVTVNVKHIYQQGKTVLLSPTSAADELTDPNSNYFFRVTSRNRVAAKDMVSNWANKYDKIALFYTPGKKFSESLRSAFLSELPKGKIAQEFYLTNPQDNASNQIAKAKAAGAKAIAIFPDAYTDAIERDRVLSIIKANQGKLPILGASLLRDIYMEKLNPELLKNLTISVSIHPSDRRYIDADKLNQAPKWWGSRSQIHDRIINSYDGMQVLLAALDKANNREDVRTAISNPNFSANGITGKISFKGSDRAQDINTLVTPQCDTNKCEGFKRSE